MYYSEFITAIQEKISESFPQDVNINLERIPKNNGVIEDALIIRLPGQNIVPTIYLAPFYDDYIQGQSLDSITSSIYDFYYKNLPSDICDIKDLIEFEKNKSNICFSLINYNSNMDRLRDLIYVRKLDLAMIFHVDVSIEGIMGSFTLTKDYLRLWSTTPDELADIAIKNSPVLKPACLLSMTSILNRMNHNLPTLNVADLGIEDNDLFYVLTNQNMYRGAACMFYPDELKKFSKKIDDDIYIVPSSIHEVIVLPSTVIEDTCEIKRIIEIVNHTELDTIDILSGNLYFYSRCDDEISIAI